MPMRQLRSCDFCGDDAAGVYEVLPLELSPTEAEQHRVVLCTDCVGTLEAVVNPLLERLGVDTGGGDAEPTTKGSSPSPSPSGRPSPTVSPGRDRHDRGPATESDTDTPPETGPAAGVEASDTRESGSSPDERTSRGDPAPTRDEPVPSDERASSGDDGSDSSDAPPSPDGDDPAASPGDERAQPAGDDPDDGPVEWGTMGPGATDDAPDESVSDPIRDGIPSIGASDDTEPETAPTPSEPGRADGTNDPDPTDTESRDAGADSGPPDDEPEEFRTVMRLLGNREFPVERDAIVELAASAYELDDAHVRQCLDYAVDRGVIEDDDGLLRRG